MARPVGFKVEGLKEFQRSLKALDSDLPKALRIALNEAIEIVADDARTRVPRDGGRARGSVKAASTQKSARIRGGGARAPYYPWLDFGGRVGRRKSVKRPFLTDGRYIYKSYFKHRDSGDIEDSVSKALIKVAKTAGLDVTHG